MMDSTKKVTCASGIVSKARKSKLRGNRLISYGRVLPRFCWTLHQVVYLVQLEALVATKEGTEQYIKHTDTIKTCKPTLLEKMEMEFI